MNTSDPQFWMMVSSIIISVMFIVMAICLIVIAVTVRKAVRTVQNLEERFDPLIRKVDAISLQAREISVHFTEVSANLSSATKYLAESTEIIRDEVDELRVLVGETAHTARDKVQMVSRTIDRTHNQVTDTTEFVNQKIVVPAREIAAVMAGVKKGLEVLFAPAPKQIDRVYTEEEMFIG
jgi:methyl-accepting chemotaxis protein